MSLEAFGVSSPLYAFNFTGGGANPVLETNWGIELSSQGNILVPSVRVGETTVPSVEIKLPPRFGVWSELVQREVNVEHLGALDYFVRKEIQPSLFPTYIQALMGELRKKNGMSWDDFAAMARWLMFNRTDYPDGITVDVLFPEDGARPSFHRHFNIGFESVGRMQVVPRILTRVSNKPPQIESFAKRLAGLMGRRNPSVYPRPGDQINGIKRSGSLLMHAGFGADLFEEKNLPGGGVQGLPESLDEGEDKGEWVMQLKTSGPFDITQESSAGRAWKFIIEHLLANSVD